MERKDQTNLNREQYRDTSRGSESQDRDTFGQYRSERRQFSEAERSGDQQYGGRQYEPDGGYGYGRQGYAAGQSGQGYYGGRPMSEGRGVGYAGGQSARGGEEYGYGRQGGGYTPDQGAYGSSSTSQDTGVGYAGRESRRQHGGEYGRRHIGRGPKNWARSDERIREDVCVLLAEDADVDASDITVAVANCEVTLSGTVPSREQRRRAEDCAEHVPGVSHVQNNVRVAGTKDWGSSSDTRYEVARDETDSLISSDKVEGTAVYGVDRQKIGSIETVMLTKRGGKVAYAVLSFGGFLGLGTEHYPLPWAVLKYDTDLSGYVVNMTKDQLLAAPKYSADDSWDWNDPATNRRIDMYYNPWMGALL